jgi:hypothetical protein
LFQPRGELAAVTAILNLYGLLWRWCSGYLVEFKTFKDRIKVYIERIVPIGPQNCMAVVGVGNEQWQFSGDTVVRDI